jgi:fructokinase
VLAALHQAGALTKAGVAALTDAAGRRLSLGTRAAAVTVSRAGANPPWANEL